MPRLSSIDHVGGDDHVGLFQVRLVELVAADRGDQKRAGDVLIFGCWLVLWPTADWPEPREDKWPDLPADVSPGVVIKQHANLRLDVQAKQIGVVVRKGVGRQLETAAEHAGVSWA